MQTDEFNHVDMANVMSAFVAMRAAPGLRALDAIADHVNAHYSRYGAMEMSQARYLICCFALQLCSPAHGSWVIFV